MKKKVEKKKDKIVQKVEPVSEASNIVDLTREEVLEFENLDLKFILLDKELNRLRGFQRDLFLRVRDRCGVDISSSDWGLDLAAGIASRRVK